MLNIIKLDWSALKYYQKRVLILPVCLFISGWISSIYLVPLGAFLTFFFSLNSFAVEEKGDLNKLYLTLPVKRKTIVTGRYMLMFLTIFCGMLLGFILMPFVNKIAFSKWYLDLRWKFALFSFSFLLCAVLSIFMHPLLFKLGYQKGKLWGMYIPAGIFGIAYILFLAYSSISGKEMLITNMLIYASENTFLVSGGMLLLAVSFFAVSYILSIRSYEKREF